MKRKNVKSVSRSTSPPINEKTEERNILTNDSNLTETDDQNNDWTKDYYVYGIKRQTKKQNSNPASLPVYPKKKRNEISDDIKLQIENLIDSTATSFSPKRESYELSGIPKPDDPNPSSAVPDDPVTKEQEPEDRIEFASSISLKSKSKEICKVCQRVKCIYDHNNKVPYKCFSSKGNKYSPTYRIHSNTLLDQAKNFKRISPKKSFEDYVYYKPRTYLRRKFGFSEEEQKEISPKNQSKDEFLLNFNIKREFLDPDEFTSTQTASSSTNLNESCGSWNDLINNLRIKIELDDDESNSISVIAKNDEILSKNKENSTKNDENPTKNEEKMINFEFSDHNSTAETDELKKSTFSTESACECKCVDAQVTEVISQEFICQSVGVKTDEIVPDFSLEKQENGNFCNISEPKVNTEQEICEKIKEKPTNSDFFEKNSSLDLCESKVSLEDCNSNAQVVVRIAQSESYESNNFVETFESLPNSSLQEQKNAEFCTEIESDAKNSIEIEEKIEYSEFLEETETCESMNSVCSDGIVDEDAQVTEESSNLETCELAELVNNKILSNSSFEKQEKNNFYANGEPKLNPEEEISMKEEKSKNFDMSTENSAPESNIIFSTIEENSQVLNKVVTCQSSDVVDSSRADESIPDNPSEKQKSGKFCTVNEQKLNSEIEFASTTDTNVSPAISSAPKAFKTGGKYVSLSSFLEACRNHIKNKELGQQSKPIGIESVPIAAQKASSSNLPETKFKLADRQVSHPSPSIFKFLESVKKSMEAKLGETSTTEVKPSPPASPPTSFVESKKVISTSTIDHQLRFAQIDPNLELEKIDATPKKKLEKKVSKRGLHLKKENRSKPIDVVDIVSSDDQSIIDEKSAKSSVSVVMSDNELIDLLPKHKKRRVMIKSKSTEILSDDQSIITEIDKKSAEQSVSAVISFSEMIDLLPKHKKRRISSLKISPKSSNLIVKEEEKPEDQVTPVAINNPAVRKRGRPKKSTEIISKELK